MAELFFGDFRLDTKALVLMGAEDEVEVRPKTLELLVYLIHNRNRFVPRDELMQRLWPDVTVTASSLTQCISELRQALNDSSREPRYVETKIKQGYRFVAAVYHRPTERLELLPPPPEVARTTADRSRTWLRAAVPASVAVAAVCWVLGSWLAAQRHPVPSPVVVVSVAAAADGPADVADAVRRAIFARLADIEGITVAVDPGAVRGLDGLEVELACRDGASDTVELSVALRRLGSGETLWGWTWTTTEATGVTDGLSRDVAERVVAALRSRIGP